MCGIVGRVSAGPEPVSPIETLRDTLRHRGPDDAGIWHTTDRRVELAQRRLAIVDLSPAGHQPMPANNGQLQITFNGEIYNHQQLRKELKARGYQFVSASDTEVLLRAYECWGTDCVQHFNGMFAFAIYDARNQTVFLARDRAGEKPLFYTSLPGKFLFASELKALVADPDVPCVLNPQAVDHYFAYGYVPGDQCILQGVHKLPQGSALLVNVQELTIKRWQWWSLPQPAAAADADIHELTDRLESHLADSVKLRMQADVPVGVMLSGGIDSSLITALAARHSAEAVRTFTITFPGHKKFDEAAHARLIASHFGTQHTELAAEPATFDLLPQLAAQYDEPLADSSMVPTYLVSRQIREHATVALGGDGGDELFGGYPHYRWLQQQQSWRRRFPSRLRQAIATAATHLPMGFRGRNHLIGFHGGNEHAVSHINLYFDARSRQRLLAPLNRLATKSFDRAELTKQHLCDPSLSLLQQAMAVDFQTYLVDDILVKVDRASMLASLEVRAPFLDPQLIEFAWRNVPDQHRVNGGQSKRLLRSLATRLLPDQTDLNRKQGFSIPLNDWFKGDWGTGFRKILNEADESIFDRQQISRLIRSQERGRSNMQRLFSIAIFELWRRHYNVQTD